MKIVMASKKFGAAFPILLVLLRSGVPSLSRFIDVKRCSVIEIMSRISLSSQSCLCGWELRDL